MTNPEFSDLKEACCRTVHEAEVSVMKAINFLLKRQALYEAAVIEEQWLTLEPVLVGLVSSEVAPERVTAYLGELGELQEDILGILRSHLRQ